MTITKTQRVINVDRHLVQQYNEVTLMNSENGEMTITRTMKGTEHESPTHRELSDVEVAEYHRTLDANGRPLHMPNQDRGDPNAPRDAQGYRLDQKGDRIEDAERSRELARVAAAPHPHRVDDHMEPQPETDAEKAQREAKASNEDPRQADQGE